MNARFFSAKNPGGNTLLFTLLMLSVMLSSALVLSVIVLSAYKNSSQTLSAGAAYFAGESGIERSLYQLRREQTRLADLDVEGAMQNGGTWNLSVEQDTRELRVSLDSQETVQLDIFDGDELSRATGAASVELTWGSAGAVRLEASRFSWPVSTTLLWNEDPREGNTPNVQIDKTLGASTPFVVPLPPNHGSIVRIKPLNGTLPSARLRVLSSSGEAMPIPNILTLTSRGHVGRTTQLVRVRLPRFAPGSGLFDYVLFSGAELEKTSPAP